MISPISSQSTLRSNRTPIDPPAVADVRQYVEAVGLLVDELLLHAGGRRADEADSPFAEVVV